MDKKSLWLAMVTGDLQAVAYRFRKLNEATKEASVAFQNFAAAQYRVHWTLRLWWWFQNVLGLGERQ